MMSDAIGLRLRGTFDLRVYEHCRAHGYLSEANLVVDGALTVIVELLGGQPDKAITHFGVGTSGTPAAAGDTALAGAVLVPITAVTFPQAGHVAFDWVLGPESANGLSIREFGLFTADGTLVSRKTRAAAIEKTDAVSLEGRWTLYF